MEALERRYDARGWLKKVEAREAREQQQEAQQRAQEHPPAKRAEEEAVCRSLQSARNECLRIARGEGP
jgi:hypothetical protein